MLCSIAGMANAQYLSMQFNTADGGEHLIGLEGLEIVYTPETLVATQGANRLELPLGQLVSMQFTTLAGIENLQIDSLNDVEAFDLNGVSYGRFDSFESLKSSLANGIYVVKAKNGETFKINVKK